MYIHVCAFQVFACNIVAIIKYVDHFTKAIYYSVQTCILCTLTYMYVQTETNYCLECKKCKYNTLLNFSVCIVGRLKCIGDMAIYGYDV